MRMLSSLVLASAITGSVASPRGPGRDPPGPHGPPGPPGSPGGPPGHHGPHGPHGPHKPHGPDVLHRAPPQSVGLLPEPLNEMVTNISNYEKPANYKGFTDYVVHPIEPGEAVIGMLPILARIEYKQSNPHSRPQE